MVKYLWLYYLPLLFIPNLGFETATPFGTLTIADYLIIPYIILTSICLFHIKENHLKPRARLYVNYLIPTLLIFLWWGIISSLSIIFRFTYLDYNPVIVSLLKLGKLSIYGLGAILTIFALSRLGAEGYQKFLWVVLISGLIISFTLIISGNSLASIFPSITQYRQVFQENPTSVMMSILIAFQVGMLVQGHGTSFWRHSTMLGLAIMVLGLVVAEGRGGWVAALVAMIYLGSQLNLKQTVRLTTISLIFVLVVYSQNINFRNLVDRTISPDPEYLQEYNIGVAGLDDGGRLVIFLAEAPKVLQDPLFGRGFFHRGGQSGIFLNGSHNFFLQMFLETGIIGGVLILVLFWQMWRHASSYPAAINHLKLPIKAALIAAFTAGISGEYFYGGMVFFSLFLAYAPVGSLIVGEKKSVVFLTTPPHRADPTQR